jgi:hypothetical protein
MNIKGKLNQITGYKLPTGATVDQDRTFGLFTKTRCRVEARVMRIRDFDGDMVQSSHVIYTAEEIDENALWFLPGDDGSDNATGRRGQMSLSSPSVDGKQTLYKTWVGSRK